MSKEDLMIDSRSPPSGENQEIGNVTSDFLDTAIRLITHHVILILESLYTLLEKTNKSFYMHSFKLSS